MGKEHFHSIHLIEDRCVGCTDCIKRCPTEAIRVRDGKARIMDERCIDCGMCIRVCRNHAKAAITDSLADLSKYKINIALPAPTLYSEFKHVSDVNIILTAIKRLGFDDVFEVAFAAEAVTYMTDKYINENPMAKKPIISSPCPVVTRLVAMKFPSLVDNVLPILSPMEVAATAAKNFYENRGYQREDIGVFFISPCAAKNTYIHKPIGIEKSQVDGVISILDIFIPLMSVINTMKIEDIELLAQAGKQGRNWALSGGELSALDLDNAIAVDGVDNVLAVLEAMEDGQIEDVTYVEALACMGGCVGGPLTSANGFVAKHQLAKILKKSAKERRDLDLRLEDIDYGFSVALEPVSSVMRLDDDMEVALKKLEEIERLKSILPAIDCGACGAPTCQALSEDIVMGKSELEDCVFILKRRVRELVKQAKIEQGEDIS